MAQLVERVLGKDEVPGPNPGSSLKYLRIVHGMIRNFHFQRKHMADCGMHHSLLFLFSVELRTSTWRVSSPAYQIARFISDAGANHQSDLKCSLWRCCRTVPAGSARLLEYRAVPVRTDYTAPASYRGRRFLGHIAILPQIAQPLVIIVHRISLSFLGYTA